MDSRVLNVLADRVLELGPKPEENGPYRNFKLTRDADGIAWLLFDREGSSANTLSADVIEELDAVLAALESQRPAGLVIRSAKKSGFIAGADVNEFRGATDPRAVETAIGRAHAVIDRLEDLKIPSVAVIHGFCLGGGLEVALACQSRIAIDGARFGFPEVMLGLHPGLGGTARFTRLVNPMQAMTLMLTGRTIDARRAKSLGLVDARGAGAPCPQCRQGRAVRPPETRPAGSPQRGSEFHAGARLPCQPDAQRGRKGRAARALSRALRADRSLGKARRRQGGDAGGRKDLVRQSDGDADGAEPDPGVLPARADEEARRQRQQGRPCPCHRRRRDGRRHRGLVRQSGPAGDAWPT